MSKLLKQLLAVALAFQTTLSGISTIVHAEEPEEEPEYTAETVADEEEETVLEETGDEENVIVIEQEEEEPEVTEVEEEPEETETPEVTEPEETEVPEVTEPEETEEPEITEEPEEPEEPEVTEPEEPEEPAGIEDPWEEPEELLEWDESEPFQLKITPRGTTIDFKFTGISVSGNKYTFTCEQDISAISYIVAINDDDVTWFLNRNESFAGTNSREVQFDIPAGQYELHIAYYDESGDFYISGNHYELVVFDAPKVVGTGSFKGSEYGYIDIDLTDIVSKNYDVNPGLNDYFVLLKVNEDDPGLNLAKIKTYADDNIFRVRLGDKTAYDNAGTYEDYPYGSFDLSYQIRDTGAVAGGYIFASGNTTHVDVMSEFVPTSIDVDFSDFPVLYYKGATLQLTPKFGPYTSEHTEYEGIDRRVKYSSSNTKLVKVDSNGKLTAVGMPPADQAWWVDPTIVEITVTSLAYPGLSTIAQVELRNYSGGKSDAGIISNDVWYSPFTWSIGKQMDDGHYELALFNIEVPEGYTKLNGMPVTFTVDKGSGLTLYDTVQTSPGEFVPNTAQGTIYSAPFSNNNNGYGSAIVYVHAEDAGIYKVNVTTPIGKTASVTVNVDGISNNLAGAAGKDSQYFVNGKPVAGWLRYDITTDSYVYGKDVFNGYTDPANQLIYYADPKTKKLVTGDPWNSLPDTVAKIDGKLYAFNAGNGLKVHTESGQLTEGWISVEHETLAYEFEGPYEAYVNAKGEIQTGWVNTNTDGWLYMDPSFGYPVTSEFVPARSGKGYVYVNNYGKPEGIHVDSGATQTFDTADGLYRVFMPSGPDKYFWVKNGAFYTGWMYLHFDSKTAKYTWNTTKKGAHEKMYFDPNDHGAMQRGTFTVGTKHYLSTETYAPQYWGGDYYAVQLLNCFYFGDGKFPEKYAMYVPYGDYSQAYVIDADGAIVYDKLVKIAKYNVNKYDRYYVYADEDGKLRRDGWALYKGKVYYFDSHGLLVTDALYPSDLRYLDANPSPAVVYTKLKNAKKPEQGYTYHSADGRKLTSLMIYNASGDMIAMLDAKGNLAVNAVVTVKLSQYPGASSHTYAVDEYGNIVINNTSYLYKAVTVKGKNYIVDDTGEVQKNSTYPVQAYFENYGTQYVMADKNGVLIKNTFKTVTTEANGTFNVWFTDYGFALSSCPEVYRDENGNSYCSMIAKKKAWLCIRTSGNYLGFVIPGKTKIPYSGEQTFKTGWFGGDDSPIYLNKDGSIKTGLVKHGNTIKYIATISVQNIGYALTIPGRTENVYGINRNMLYQINGKTYFFDQNGNVVTGWVHFEHAIAIDLYSAIIDLPGEYTLLDDVYMYFDDKTGAAVTSSAKVLTPSVINGEISLGEEGNFQNNAKRVNTTSSLKKLYFTSDGALIHDENTKIGKKLSEVGEDGVVTTGKPHWSDGNKNSYVLKNGVLATGRKKIDGKFYYFDTVTGLKVTNALRKTGKKWYYYGEHGEQETPALSGNTTPVILPTYMQEEWGKTAYVMTGSTNYKNLTAIWNKDGSLSKIVYAGTNTPAAGESVSFGLWDYSDDDLCRSYVTAGLNGYVLDSKGLPMTGVTADFTYEGDSTYGKYSLNVGKDGTKVVAGTGLSLVKTGKKYYVMQEGLVYDQQGGIVEISDWSSLPASEQKNLNELAWIASCYETGLYVMLDQDGSVATNTKRYGQVFFGSNTYFGSQASGEFTTNKQGVVLDLIAPIFKAGKSTYFSNAIPSVVGSGSIEVEMQDVNNIGIGEPKEILATIKYNGNKILGFYNAETGKPLNGVYFANIGKGMAMWFKKGQPQSGNKTFNYYGFKMKFYVSPDLPGTIPMWG